MSPLREEPHLPQSSTITLKVGARVHALDAYWPCMGRPVQKERVIEGAQLRDGAWRWTDPKNGRTRWAKESDAVQS